MDGKVHKSENTIDMMKIEHHLITKCYISKLKGSFACLLTVYSLKLKCLMQTNIQIETQAVNYVYNKSVEHSRSCQAHE